MLRTARRAGYDATQSTSRSRSCRGAVRVCHSSAPGSCRRNMTAHDGRTR